MLTSFPYTALRGFASRFYDQNARLLLTPTIYNAEIGTAANGKQVTAAVPINANADFIMIGCGSNGVDGTLQITNSATSLAFFSEPIPIFMFGGDSSQGISGQCMNYPEFVGRNSALLCQYISPAAAGVEHLRIALIGFHVRQYN